jgi:putative tryptophan/tyrosine transport system substrate-binding protein
MRRRSFITLLGSLASWPSAVCAQQSAMQTIGFLNSASPAPFASYVAAFRRGLQDEGYIEGQNLAIEFRWADGQTDRLASLAVDLVSHGVSVVAATGGPIPAAAAKAATETIPIVFLMAGDPVKRGLVASFNRPGGNITGYNLVASELDGKRLGLLHDLVPNADRVAVLLNPENPNVATQRPDVEAAARVIGEPITIINASNPSELDAVLTKSQLDAAALLVGADPFFTSQRQRIVDLVASLGVPAIYEWREFADAGGLISYGPSLADGYRQVGVYVGRILKGEKPADLPVIQPTRFELVINMKTAKALGLMVPGILLAQADEVIE